MFLEHGTRRRHAGGVTASPAGEWTVPHARTLARTPGRRVEDIRFLLRGRGPNVTASFDAVVPATGTTILISAVQARRAGTRPASASWLPCAARPPTGN